MLVVLQSSTYPSVRHLKQDVVDSDTLDYSLSCMTSTTVNWLHKAIIKSRSKHDVNQ